MGQLGLNDKYPDLFTTVGQINDNENLDIILISKKELQEIYKGETRLFGFYESANLCKITFLSLNNSRLESVDYYFSSDKLFYVLESSNLLTKSGVPIKEKNHYSRYIFQDDKISDYERVGYSEITFEKRTKEKVIIQDTLRNIGLLKEKRTETKNEDSN